MAAITCKHHPACPRGPRGRRGLRGYRGPHGYRGLPGGCACPCSGNLLRNPSFDDFGPDTSLQMPSAWGSPYSQYVAPPANDGDIHSGNGSVVFQLPGSPAHCYIEQYLTALPNCCYCLEFWLKGATGGGQTSFVQAMLGVKRSSAPADPLLYSVNANEQSLNPDAWNSYRIVTPPIPTDATQVFVTIDVSGTGKAARVDDVILTVCGCGSDRR